MFLLPSLPITLALVSRSSCHFVQTIQGWLWRAPGSQRCHNPTAQRDLLFPASPHRDTRHSLGSPRSTGDGENSTHLTSGRSTHRIVFVMCNSFSACVNNSHTELLFCTCSVLQASPSIKKKRNKQVSF